MQKQLEEFIATQGLFHRKHRLLVALSGGVDSVVLIHLLVKLGYDVAAAHANFGLRGTESDGDEKFVKKYCKNIGVQLFVKNFETALVANSRRKSIQETARHLRYEWFNELIENEGFDYILTAHHGTDSVETILLNLTRGSGPAGLTGIRPIKDRLVRPLLCFTSEEVRQFAQNEKLKWREDSSNTSLKYKRNLLRHKAIPTLHRLNPGLEKTIADHQPLLVEAVDGIHSLCNAELDRWLKNTGKSFHIKSKIINDFPFPLHLLKLLTEKFGFSHATRQNIWLSCQHNTSKKFFSATHQLSTGNTLVLEPIQVDRPVYEEINSLNTTVSMPDACLELSTRQRVLTVQRKNPCYLDAGKLRLPLMLRNWQPGDRLTPTGMKGSKKVSDLLNDLKMTNSEKKRVTVLLSMGKIVCLPGMRVAESCKVTEKTNEVLCIKLTKTQA